ncbi:MFS general substrate transporter [Aaosphaeria arxii CBS 175.79]|uniref:MFS general substrate transporter n=1 Tax=Aaosphaeria arxii CBS 175.79 TaxID=1450172 RepID=A0A6A5X6A7_9PLEO|nr:MFS general substrate transporter [Aaosphaeria arxii CBS 175.79]KAF2008545.1 MFS general substrate transporter [Aaosphaeria arxii CBS 175.79]
MSLHPKVQQRAGNNSTELWPPGTVLLEDNSGPEKKFILQPRPSEDPNDPLNWAKWRKAINFGFVCFYSVLVSEFISSSGPTWTPMHKQLGFGYDMLNNAYAAGSAALGVGSLLLIPFALKLGRRPIYLFSTVMQFGLSIWSARMWSVADLMSINLLQCLFGSLAEVIVQMTVADVFFVHQRGRLNSTYIWLWKTAGALGSLIAGFITTGLGWRWVWWLNAIFFGLFSILIALFYEETKYCPPAIVEQVAGNDLQPSGDSNVIDQSRQDKGLGTDAINSTKSLGSQEQGVSEDLYATKIDHNIPMKTWRQRLALTTISTTDEGFKDILRHLYQPLVLLTTVPAVLWTASVYGVLVALQDVISTCQSTFLTRPPYNFTASGVGFMSIAKFIGLTIGSLLGGVVSDRVIIYAARRNNGVFEPEARLWSFIPFILFVPAGGLMFGIGLNNGAPWPVIAVGLALYNVGVAPILAITVTYLTDSYEDVVGDALVGVTFLRNAISAAFVFAVDPWVEATSIKWCLVAIVLISMFFMSLSVVFIIWGKQFRGRTAARYQYYARRQFRSRG